MNRCILTLWATIVLAGTLPAEFYIWSNKSGGDWNNAANWNFGFGSTYPNSPADTALFTNIELGNTTIDINIPAGNTVTVGSFAVVEATNTYRFRQPGTLILDNGLAGIPCDVGFTRGNMPGASWPGVVFQELTLRVESDVVISNGGGSSFYPLFNGQNLEGDADITVLGRIEIGRANPNFTGRLILNAGSSISRQYGSESNLYVNGTIICSGGSFDNSGAGLPYNVFADMVISNGEFRACNGSNFTREMGGDVTVIGTWSCTTDNGTSNSLCVFTGDVGGVGVAQFSSQLRQSNLFVGSISPGTNIGTLTFVQTSKMVYDLGTAGNPVELRIDFAGDGGVPGLDHDLFIISNHHSQVSLETLDLYISGQDSPFTTNWFLYVTGTNIVDGTEFNQVRYASGLGGAVVYDYENERVGIMVVPEAAAGAAVFALLVAARRMKLGG